jgi:hypothetical protein
LEHQHLQLLSQQQISQQAQQQMEQH